MSFNQKPKVAHPSVTKNKEGLTRRDYEGALSTLCAGCGHDSVTAAIIHAIWELSLPPHRIAKLSGIGCSSKTPTYFASDAHGINSVHGRMAAVATGASAANRDLILIGISGDGDSLSIGLGQFAHTARRNVNMLYILENNGVYGLTKGQFSASADVGSQLKKGEKNPFGPIDPAQIAINMGASFVARSFSGDKAQLVPLIKAGLSHYGFAFIDVISPCVSFNDHESSTKSYMHTRENIHEAAHIDLIRDAQTITADYQEGTTKALTLHDGSRLILDKIDTDFDPTDSIRSLTYIRDCARKGQVATGLLYIDRDSIDMHDHGRICDTPLVELPMETLIPGNAALQKFQDILH
ncbi:MAG: 2-oxoglutarate ferredoxin oxidoreductase subunit beta [Spirochaeta sp. LUC14_002_19_P3]|nr:MAG: 2-oxoglutarate ferredoxin oxidoreductase subunit beta [Spirochaeta sp. LUC14_002_19_P3]